jgi:hypothetical protein
MKLPENMMKESSHKVNVLNTMSLTGISVLWGVMLGLISPWWMIASVMALFAGFGSEVTKRSGSINV